MPPGGRDRSVRHVMAATTPATPEWSVGAVLAEREIDPQTYLLVVRADAGLAASLDLRRGLLGVRLTRHSTVLVDFEGAGGISAPIQAALMYARRR
jgi:hypothetical protein